MSIYHCSECDSYQDDDHTPMVGEVCEWCSYEREEPTPTAKPGALLDEYVQGLNAHMTKEVAS